MENCLIIRKSIQLNLPIIDSLQFPIIGSLFLLTHNYETFSSSKGLLKLKSVNSKKYGTEAHGMIFKKLFHLMYYVTFHLLS